DLRLRAGDERGQAVDPATVRDHRLRLRLLRLVLRLWTMLAVAVFPRLLVALIGLPLALMIARAVVAHIGLLLHRHEARLLAKTRKIVAFVLTLLGDHFTVAARRLLRLVLTELPQRGRERAQIVLGVLILVTGGHRIHGR